MSQLRAGKLPGVSPNNWVVGAVLAKRVEICPRQKLPSMPTLAASVAFSSTCRPWSRVTYLRRQYFCQSELSPNWASGQRWMAKVWLPSWLSSDFGVALQHAHGGHHDDDGKHADQHAEQRERRAQLVRRQGVHGHGEAFAHFAEQQVGASCHHKGWIIGLLDG